MITTTEAKNINKKHLVTGLFMDSVRLWGCRDRCTERCQRATCSLDVRSDGRQLPLSFGTIRHRKDDTLLPSRPFLCMDGFSCTDLSVGCVIDFCRLIFYNLLTRQPCLPLSSFPAAETVIGVSGGDWLNEYFWIASRKSDRLPGQRDRSISRPRCQTTKIDHFAIIHDTLIVIVSMQMSIYRD